MALGYAPTVQDVLDYYSRPDVADALCRAGQGRKCEFYDAPTSFNRFVDDTDTHFLPHTLREQIHDHLQASMGHIFLQAVPVRYPGLHGSIEQDIVLEVDDKSSQKAAHEGGKRIQEFLEARGLPYRLKFSGNCSMHFVLPRSFYEPHLREGQRATAFPRLVRWFQNQLREEVGGKLDESFSDLDHFLRLPYSLNEWTGLASIPLRPDQYDGFRPEMAQIGNVQVSLEGVEEIVSSRQQEGLNRLVEEALRDE